jgi:hypothetical protein
VTVSHQPDFSPPSSSTLSSHPFSCLTSFYFHNQHSHSHQQPFTMQLITSILATSALLSSNVFAHPGQSALEMRAEMAERAAFMQHSKKDLSHCAAKMKARGLEARSLTRREAVAKNARKKRDIAPGTPPSSLYILTSILILHRRSILQSP